MDDSTVLEAVGLFKTKFKYEPAVAAFAPGRVNLIGEHTDYNGGFVLPMALPMKTVVVGSRNKSGQCRILSKSRNDAEIIEFAMDSNLSVGKPEWANYVKGVLFQYLSDIPDGFGFDCAISTTVPIGSGLSSSASLEVAVATFVEALCGGIPAVSSVDKARRCQKAEHDFAHVPCGIMDQYIAAMGAEGNLLLIDCRSNTFELVPFGSRESVAKRESPVVVITNSNVKHALSGSEYPDRVRQCRQAVQALQQKFPQVLALRDATLEMLESVREDVSSTVFARARHCISEDRRTLEAVRALRAKDYAAVGRCMTESHVSLREDYQVSCAEIDLLVDLALQCPGVLGSRITGGGFGGCTVTLVERDSVGTLQAFVGEEYLKRTGTQCEFYAVTPSAGSGSLFLATTARGSTGTQRRRRAMIDYLLPAAVVAAVATIAYFCAARSSKK